MCSLMVNVMESGVKCGESRPTLNRCFVVNWQYTIEAASD